MSLGPAIIREPGDELPVAQRLIYRTFMQHLLENGTSTTRAVLRTAADCGVSRRRVLEVIRAVNDGVLPWEAK